MVDVDFLLMKLEIMHNKAIDNAQRTGHEMASINVPLKPDELDLLYRITKAYENDPTKF